MVKRLRYSGLILTAPLILFFVAAMLFWRYTDFKRYNDQGIVRCGGRTMRKDSSTRVSFCRTGEHSTSYEEQASAQRDSEPAYRNMSIIAALGSIGVCTTGIVLESKYRRRMRSTTDEHDNFIA